MIVELTRLNVETIVEVIRVTTATLSVDAMKTAGAVAVVEAELPSLFDQGNKFPIYNRAEAKEKFFQSDGYIQCVHKKMNCFACFGICVRLWKQLKHIVCPHLEYHSIANQFRPTTFDLLCPVCRTSLICPPHQSLDYLLEKRLRTFVISY